MLQKYSQLTKTLLDWFEVNRRVLPWREERTAYGTWISETMLQQTRVTTVIPYFKRFMDQFPDILSLSRAPLDEVYKVWEGLGYYSRAGNLLKGARFCADYFGNKLPDDYAGLLSVPGIGPYTAGAVASLAFGLPEPAVDGNAIRVFSMLFALDIYPQDNKARAEVTLLVRKLLPEDRAGDFNEAIMDLGATVCVPGNPSCKTCPVSIFCEAFLLNRQTELPLHKPRKESTVIPYTIVVLKRGMSLFIRQRPATGLLANLFEFPSFPGLLNPEDIKARLFRDYGILPDQITSIISLGEASHVFSHLKLKMEGYLVEIPDKKNSLLFPISEKQVQGEYYLVSEAKKLALPSAIKAYTSAVLP